ncbi:MAG: hypothetical protein ACKPJD_28510, partial [Planctomycetaceae bacterium]
MKHGLAVLLIILCAARNGTVWSQEPVSAEAAAPAAPTATYSAVQARIDGRAELSAAVGMRAV